MRNFGKIWFIYRAKTAFFNVDKMGLSWKRMPHQNYISEEEKLMPGYKAAKDRLTLWFDGNASDYMKLKPLLVYHSENPKPLKMQSRALFLLCGRVIPKPGLHRSFSRTGFSITLSQTEKYCLEKDVQFNILLLLNNVLDHPPFMDNFYPNIKVVHPTYRPRS